MIFKGTDNEVIKFSTFGGETKYHTFGQTGDGAGTIVSVLAIKQESPTRTFTAYKNQENAEADKDGTVYTIDCSGATFGGALPMTVSTAVTPKAKK